MQPAMSMILLGNSRAGEEPYTLHFLSVVMISACLSRALISLTMLTGLAIARRKSCQVEIEAARAI